MIVMRIQTVFTGAGEKCRFVGYPSICSTGKDVFVASFISLTDLFSNNRANLGQRSQRGPLYIERFIAGGSRSLRITVRARSKQAFGPMVMGKRPSPLGT
ncbi:hypothetical protein [uncultured Roseibium sp.]|uniref:hypothetical protein n=1 Tax=uncultured Roseibium sp. TaxID=1936171 RepID=UPI003216A9F5